MINIFFGFWKNISLIILTATFLYCYTSLPESIAYMHNGEGLPIRFANKQQFFYVVGGVLFAFNVLLSFLKTALLRIDFKQIFSQSEWASNNFALTALLRGWIDAFVALVNTFLVFVLFGINNINSSASQKLDFNYNWMLLLAAVIVMLVLFSLPLRILFGHPSQDEES